MKKFGSLALALLLTLAGSAVSGGYSDSIDFVRPFVYVIYETNYGLPIFIGLVNHIN